MTTTDDTALQEQIARAVHAESTAQLVANVGAPTESWEDAPENRRERFRDQAAAVLPIIRAEVAKARAEAGAEALRVAAEDLFYDGDNDRPMYGCHELYDRADRIEKEQNDGR